MDKNNKLLTTPVAFIIFNRPDTTQRVFDEIKKVQPKQLFVIADGARNNNEWKLCKQARDIINQVDWDCEVQKNYSDKNLGCKIRVSSGIDWFFENVEEGIILEDDCLPHQSFFRYCEKLLEKYRNNDKIMCISGDNFQNNIKRGEYNYYFSIYNHCCGWASWKRSWKYFDIEMKDFSKFKEKNKIKNIFKKKNAQKYWIDIFQRVYDGKINSWAYIWTYACWKKNGLTCLPNVNLISNIGYDERGTHAKNKNDKSANIPTKKINFPLIYPAIIRVNKKADDYTNKYFFNIRRQNKIIKNIKIHLKKNLKKLKMFDITKKIYLKIKIKIKNNYKFFDDLIKNQKFYKLHKKYKNFTMIPENIFCDNLKICNQFKNIDGLIVECGVWKGGMSGAMAEIFGNKRKYYLFDSFKGLPLARNVDGEKAILWQSNKNDKKYFNNCSAEINFAKKAMQMSGATSYELIKGWFSKTLPNFKPDIPIAILRLDGDWYDSTIQCLNNLYIHVAKGGIIIIDDYYIWNGCTKAIYDFLSKNNLSDRIHETKNGVCYIIKQ